MVSDWLSLMLEEIARRREERQRGRAEEEQRRAPAAREPSAEPVPPDANARDTRT